MSYTVAAGVGVLGALLLDLVVLGTRLVLARVFWVTYAIVLAGQLIFNGALSKRRIIWYAPHAIMGLRVVYAPVEDLAFGFALVLTSLAIWVRLGTRATGDAPRVPPPR